MTSLSQTTRAAITSSSPSTFTAKTILTTTTTTTSPKLSLEASIGIAVGVSLPVLIFAVVCVIFVYFRLRTHQQQPRHEARLQIRSAKAASSRQSRRNSRNYASSAHSAHSRDRSRRGISRGSSHRKLPVAAGVSDPESTGSTLNPLRSVSEDDAMDLESVPPVSGPGPGVLNPYDRVVLADIAYGETTLATEGAGEDQ